MIQGRFRGLLAGSNASLQLVEIGFKFKASEYFFSLILLFLEGFEQQIFFRRKSFEEVSNDTFLSIDGLPDEITRLVLYPVEISVILLILEIPPHNFLLFQQRENQHCNRYLVGQEVLQKHLRTLQLFGDMSILFLRTRLHLLELIRQRLLPMLLNFLQKPPHPHHQILLLEILPKSLPLLPTAKEKREQLPNLPPNIAHTQRQHNRRVLLIVGVGHEEQVVITEVDTSGDEQLLPDALPTQEDSAEFDEELHPLVEVLLTRLKFGEVYRLRSLHQDVRVRQQMQQI